MKGIWKGDEDDLNFSFLRRRAHKSLWQRSQNWSKVHEMLCLIFSALGKKTAKHEKKERKTKFFWNQKKRTLIHYFSILCHHLNPEMEYNFSVTRIIIKKRYCQELFLLFLFSSFLFCFYFCFTTQTFYVTPRNDSIA